jgi:hypothetical protein
MLPFEHHILPGPLPAKEARRSFTPIPRVDPRSCVHFLPDYKVQLRSAKSRKASSEKVDESIQLCHKISTVLAGVPAATVQQLVEPRTKTGEAMMLTKKKSTHFWALLPADLRIVAQVCRCRQEGKVFMWP